MWRPHTQLVRLDDAGMSVQMAEYVCHAVIRHFRSSWTAMRRDMQRGKWSFRKPRSRSECPVGVMGLGVLGAAGGPSLWRMFDFPVHGWSQSAKQVDGVQCWHGAKQFEAFLQHPKCWCACCL